MASENKLPAMEDFSTEAIKAHVSHKTSQNMFTWIPPALGIGGGLLAFVIADGGFFAAMLLAGGGAFFGLCSFIVDKTVRKDVYESDYILDYNERMKEHANTVAIHLTREFDRLGMQEQTSLVIRLGKFIENFKMIVGNTFAEGQMTHDRYIGVGQNLYTDALNKLERLHAKYISFYDINVEANNIALEEIDGDESKHAKRTRKAIQSRLEQREAGELEIRNLTADIQDRLTSMSQLADKVASVESGSGDDAFGGILAEASIMMETSNALTSERSLN